MSINFVIPLVCTNFATNMRNSSLRRMLPATAAALCFSLFCTSAAAQTASDSSATDSTVLAATDSVSSLENDSTIAPQKRSFVRRAIDYFFRSNKGTGKKFDFGVLPGPHFSSTAGLGLGVVATGVYSMDRSDPALPKSNVAIYGDMTTKGFLMIGVKGNNIFPKKKYRLDYRLYIYTFPTDFWGVGFDNGKIDSNETSYRRIRFDAMARFMFRIAPDMYIGPMVNYQYVQARDIDAAGLHLFRGENLTQQARTIGLSYTYDTRDFILNAYRGWFLQIDQTFTPRFLGNDYCYSSTELTTSIYRRVWKGGILAGEFHSRFNYGNPGWSMMCDVGSTSRMRGYYEGRYRDKNIIEMQVELRQHVWKRNGIVLFAGVGQVFPKFDALRWNRILPNGGFGYRWEFKHRVNVRVDCGFTREGAGFMFNINEAF